MTKPSINWDHVDPKYKWLASDGEGGKRHYLYAIKPYIDPLSDGWNFDYPKPPDRDDSGSIIDTPVVFAGGFCTFTPGDCPWQESLVERHY